MDVATYKFQSSYSSPVQVGTLDTSSVKKEDTAQKEEVKVDKPQNFDVAAAEQKSAPAFKSAQKVDLYA
jgi:hypothetical protein